MDLLDLKLNKQIIKDHIGYEPNWTEIFEIYKEHKEYFQDGRVKAWEGNPHKDLIRRANKWDRVYLCDKEGNYTIFTKALTRNKTYFSTRQKNLWKQQTKTNNQAS